MRAELLRAATGWHDKVPGWLKLVLLLALGSMTSSVWLMVGFGSACFEAIDLEPPPLDRPPLNGDVLNMVKPLGCATANHHSQPITQPITQPIASSCSTTSTFSTASRVTLRAHRYVAIALQLAALLLLFGVFKPWASGRLKLALAAADGGGTGARPPPAAPAGALPRPLIAAKSPNASKGHAKGHRSPAGSTSPKLLPLASRPPTAFGSIPSLAPPPLRHADEDEDWDDDANHGAWEHVRASERPGEYLESGGEWLRRRDRLATSATSVLGPTSGATARHQLSRAPPPAVPRPAFRPVPVPPTTGQLWPATPSWTAPPRPPGAGGARPTATVAL